jgi:translation initiation factor IF-2
MAGRFPPGRGPNRPGFRRGPPGPQTPRVRIPGTEMSEHKKVIKIEENVSLQKLAGMMSLKVTDVLMRLLSMGMTGVNINTTLDADTAKILASEFGWTVEDVAVTEEAALQEAMGLVQVTDEALKVSRPPIVTVMGHVDHGKTSLLDRIRKATVAAGEAGGITQHIGAYRVETARGTIAFLDTPGHEAFTAMRMRGAQATDIVILVVAGDDGVMPQTKEAIAHATAAKVPIIVAINKMDKPGADPERVKRELAALGLQPEEWGGTTLFCPVSALTGAGVEELLENVALQSEVLELRADPSRKASGVVIEALLDRGRGPVARCMIQDGTLKVGDILIAGPAYGKVRAMTDEFGRSLQKAGPSTPVEVLGLNEVPSAGDPVHAVKDAKQAEEIAEQRRKRASTSLIPKDSRVSLDALQAKLSEGDHHELKLIVKGDVQGSVEAVGQALVKLTTPKVKVTIVHAGVGAITEGDVNLGVASKAIIVGFNVRPAGKAASIAETGGVEIRTYNIIYNAVDDIRSAMEGLLPATKIEKELGKAEVRKVFNITKTGIIAGCMVVQGLVRRNAEARLVRGGNVVWTGKIENLKRLKDDAKEVAEGFECGISLHEYEGIKELDVIECYEVEEIKTKLEDA